MSTMVHPTQLMSWGGGAHNVPWICKHGGCYATDLLGWGGGVITFPPQLVGWGPPPPWKSAIGAWRLLKQGIPDRLVTKECMNKAEINSSLWTYIRTWQWEWEVGQTGDRRCLYWSYWDKIVPGAQFTRCRGPDARKQRNAKRSFLDLHFRHRYKQISL